MPCGSSSEGELQLPGQESLESRSYQEMPALYRAEIEFPLDVCPVSPELLEGVEESLKDFYDNFGEDFGLKMLRFEMSEDMRTMYVHAVAEGLFQDVEKVILPLTELLGLFHINPVFVVPSYRISEVQ